MLADSIPVLLALGTAMAFATSLVLVRMGVRESSSLVALVVTLTVNVAVLWSYSLLQYEFVIDLWAWRYFILAGIFAPVLARLCNYIGIKRIGVNLSVPISNANPMVSVVLAVFFLGETLPLLGVPAVLAVVFGGSLLATVGRSSDTAVELRYFVFPLLAMFLFGAAQVVRKVALAYVTYPVVGAAVSMTVSWLIALAYVGLRSGEFPIDRRALRYFLPAGAVSSLGVALLYTALDLGQVVIVTPMLNTSPLFALGLTYLLVREGELFNWRVVTGTVSIVVGVALLVIVS
jgi:drug/metabolite transporter (DMT)-like permease